MAHGGALLSGVRTAVQTLKPTVPGHFGVTHWHPVVCVGRPHASSTHNSERAEHLAHRTRREPRRGPIPRRSARLISAVYVFVRICVCANK